MSTLTFRQKAHAGNLSTSLSGRELLKRYSTVATIVTFAIAAVTGVLLFFHIGNNYLMGLHEWMSMAFVVAAAFHLLRHVLPFKILLSKHRTWVATALALLITVGFIGTATMGEKGSDPLRQLIGASLSAPVSALSQVVGTTPAEISVRFAQAGIADVTVDQTLKDIAAATGKDIRQLVGILMDGGSKR